MNDFTLLSCIISLFVGFAWSVNGEWWSHHMVDWFVGWSVWEKIVKWIMYSFSKDCYIKNHSWSPLRWSTGLYVHLKQTLADTDQRVGNVQLYEGRNVAVWYQEASIAQTVECWPHKLVVWGSYPGWGCTFVPQDCHIYLLLCVLGHLCMLWGKVFIHVHWLP